MKITDAAARSGNTAARIYEFEAYGINDQNLRYDLYRGLKPKRDVA